MLSISKVASYIYLPRRLREGAETTLQQAKNVYTTLKLNNVPSELPSFLLSQISEVVETQINYCRQLGGYINSALKVTFCWIARSGWHVVGCGALTLGTWCRSFKCLLLIDVHPYLSPAPPDNTPTFMYSKHEWFTGSFPWGCCTWLDTECYNNLQHFFAGNHVCLYFVPRNHSCVQEILAVRESLMRRKKRM